VQGNGSCRSATNWEAEGDAGITPETKKQNSQIKLLEKDFSSGKIVVKNEKSYLIPEGGAPCGVSIVPPAHRCSWRFSGELNSQSALRVRLQRQAGQEGDVLEETWLEA